MCECCDQLAVEVARLRALVDPPPGPVERLCARYDLTDQQARFVLRLYQASGDRVAHRDMHAALPARFGDRAGGASFLSNIACHVRQRMGDGALKTARLGYRLTKYGCEQVDETLNADERGVVR